MGLDIVALGVASEAERDALAITPVSTFTPLELALGFMPIGPFISKPNPWSPKLGVIWCSGTSPSILPAGNDSTGDGSRSAPYATLGKALSVTPATGDYLIVGDGTFSENTGSSGRLVLAGTFTLPVVITSITGVPSNCIITNASGTNGVVSVRSSSSSNIQFVNVTIQPSTDGCPTIISNPTASSVTSKNIQFFGCVIAQRSGSSSNSAIRLDTDNPASGWYFVDCVFRRDLGGSTNFNPSIVTTQGQTQSISNQPLSDIVFWGCRTSDGQWFDWGYNFAGIAGLTVAWNQITIASGQHAFLLGTDTSGDNTPKVTGAYVGMNTLSCSSSVAHGVLVGSNAVNPVVEGNFIFSTLQGIVVKGCVGYTVRNNYIQVTSTNTGSCLYAKASTGGYWYNNSVLASNSTGGTTTYGWNEDYDNISGVKAGTNTLVGNYIRGVGSSVMLVNWAPSSGSTGGAVSNYNVYETVSSAALGSVRGTLVSTISGMTAAWASNGLPGDSPSNDNASSLNPVTGFLEISTTASQVVYALYSTGHGFSSDGIDIKQNQNSNYQRFAWRLTEVSSGNYKRPIPIGLTPGRWYITVKIRVGPLPSLSDPTISNSIVNV